MRASNWILCGCSLLFPRLCPAAPPVGLSEPFHSVITLRDSARVEGILFEHRGFSEGRSLLVLLPPSYESSPERRYPVLYAFGGRLLFDDAGTEGMEWTLDEILARRPEGVPEVLVVGIESGAQALQEHAPPGSMPEARGEELLHFLTDEVQPFVAGTYRIRRERGAAFLLGTGDTALFSLYAACFRADLFAGAIALECPDVDARSMEWMREATPSWRPWIWFEQAASDKARPSNANFLAALQRRADVQVVLTGSGSSRTSRLLAALRACPWR